MKAAPPNPQLARFRHRTTQGARVPGWPEFNCVKLARAMRVHPSHLRDVLAGRLGTTTQYLEKIRQATGLTMTEIVTRMDRGREEDDIRIEQAKLRWQQRQGRKANWEMGIKGEKERG